ncbi:hypothetical protein GLYMA_04G082800v4 [Glycine max]|uniref:Uncharacterized protein n=1 Tax=Glycine max TaxID=3847 RepID=A0A0R0KE20_SOYBN|nr:hypothetical protein GYH30_009320 [Glycine max]KRH62052.1 hypothetical protein GLYMA_04G082800v4 [Glycine max]
MATNKAFEKRMLGFHFEVTRHIDYAMQLDVGATSVHVIRVCSAVTIFKLVFDDFLARSCAVWCRWLHCHPFVHENYYSAMLLKMDYINSSLEALEDEFIDDFLSDEYE